MKLAHTAALGALILASMASNPAYAHISLDTPEAPALAYVRLAVRVLHGCEGAATVGLRMQLPDGVIAAKPMPKPNWELTAVSNPSSVNEGTTAGEHSAKGHHGDAPAVREVSWRAKAGEGLPDAFYDEFVVYLRMPDTAGQTLYFPFVQECEGGKISRWIERPTQGQSQDQLRLPAFPMRVLPRS